jgi:hypothetical protein
MPGFQSMAEAKVNRWQMAGCPAFIPDDPERPHLQPTIKEKIRHKKMKDYIQKSINNSPCTMEILGNTLFDELKATELPKWKYIAK